MNHRETFYWDKKAIVDDADHPYSMARSYHFLHDSSDLESRTLESVKMPLENRVWYNYPGQSDALHEGISNRPTAIGRVLDDGTTQLSTFQYTADTTQVISATDPVGRTTFYDYAGNENDLLMRRQSTGGSNSVVLEARVYDPTIPAHKPKKIVDASGQATSFTYNAQGQVLTSTDPLNETTTYSYAGPVNGYLYSVTRAVPGATTTYTYDSAGRRSSVTDSEGYELTFAYGCAGSSPHDHVS